jgi:restriction system protein
MTMTTDITFHYPPELFNLLVDTLPLLNRSKKDVLQFFRGAGAPNDVIDELAKRLKEAPSEINKYEIAHSVLDQLNLRGEVTLRARREVLRRVVEFTNFDTCWPADQLKAKGLVTSIREVVEQKDAFTRMKQERDHERQQRLDKAEEERRGKRKRFAKIEAAKNEFYLLFTPGLSHQARGKKLEVALNNLFAAYDILVKEAFHLVGESGDGIVEQINGVIELKGSLYFVEMKWYTAPVGVPEISQHLVRLMSRAEARGIFISASDYTAPALHTSREFLQHKIIVLATLQELVYLLEQQGDLANFFDKKSQAAQIHKDPYFKPLAM